MCKEIQQKAIIANLIYSSMYEVTDKIHAEIENGYRNGRKTSSGKRYRKNALSGLCYNHLVNDIGLTICRYIVLLLGFMTLFISINSLVC